MTCPRCHTEMQGERSDFILTTGQPPGTGRVMPQWHYRCEQCDAEFVRTGWASKLRCIDSGDTGTVQ